MEALVPSSSDTWTAAARVSTQAAATSEAPPMAVWRASSSTARTDSTPATARVSSAPPAASPPMTTIRRVVSDRTAGGLVFNRLIARLPSRTTPAVGRSGGRGRGPLGGQAAGGARPQAVPGVDRGLGPVLGAQRLEDGVDVDLHGGRGHLERVGDVLVAVAAFEQAVDVALTPAEPAAALVRGDHLGRTPRARPAEPHLARKHALQDVPHLVGRHGPGQVGVRPQLPQGARGDRVAFHVQEDLPA